MALGNDYGPTLYYNGNSGVYWKYPQASYDIYFSHISPTPLNQRQIMISNYNTISEATIIYRCIANKEEYLPWAATLFARPTSTSQSATEFTVDRAIKAKLYYYRMYKNNELVSNCIPCKTTNDTIGINSYHFKK